VENLSTGFRSNIEVAECADRHPERAEALASEFGVPAHGTPALVLYSDQVDLVVNLTNPASHAVIGEAAIRHGKHVYNEKPLVLCSSRAQELGELAREKRVKLCSAPDTVLGAGAQTARHAIQNNLIGTIVGGAAFMTVPPPEMWHPSPFSLYQEGPEPLFGMEPYSVTALLHLLGPVRRVNGHAVKTFDVRNVPEGPGKVEKIQVEVSTHVNTCLEFGPVFVVSLMLSFDTHGSRTPFIEIFASNGTISVPDPNYFDCPVEVERYNGGEWREVPLTNAWRENCRGLGVWEMAQAIEKGERSRIEFESGVHVLEVMEKAITSSERGSWEDVAMQVSRPKAMPVEESATGRNAQ